jgi:hypothetical protein
MIQVNLRHWLKVSEGLTIRRSRSLFGRVPYVAFLN